MNAEKNMLITSMSEPIKELFSDIAEMELDDILKTLGKEGTLLQDVPVIRWLVLGNNIRMGIQTAIFIKKYARFIGIINKEMPSDFFYKKEYDELFTNKKEADKLVEQTIISLEHYHTERKSKLLGELFVQTFKYKNFTLHEYNILMYSIDIMHPYIGLDCLKDFYDYYTQFSKEYDEIKKRRIWQEGAKLDYYPLANTGLLHLPHGAVVCGNLGGASINDLGKKFYEFVVKKILISEEDNL
jgi:hypothetical protein